MAGPAISVVVCTHNRAGLLGYALSSLAAQDLDKALYEVIVVDNNSTDDTREVAEKLMSGHDNVRMVSEDKPGLSHARNRGWREAGGRYVAFMDDDAKASFDWCRRILDAFETVSPKPAAVGGLIRPWYESPPPAWFTDEFETRTWGDCAGFLKPPRARLGFSGSNMAFRRELLEEFGGFSADYGMVEKQLRMGEDTEFFFRINSRYPWFWYDPAIQVYHFTPEKNMRVAYRIKRAFMSGSSVARIEGRRAMSLNFLRQLAWLSFSLAKAPFSLAFSGGNRKTEAVRVVQNIAAGIGYLFGRK
jgi:glycosyltransferase involved in cell wall biosynthesis